MSESPHFEKHETPPQPKESVESVLEKGEIEKVGSLLGFATIKIVNIKDDGKALFKLSSDEFQETKKESFARTDLEALAGEIDRILGFNLVPPLVTRKIEGKIGVFQQLVDARPIEFPEEYEVSDLVGWSDMVDNAEILKAAVFDYLIDAKDRHGGNFLLDLKAKKIWLVDHDYLMYFQERGWGSDLIRAALNKGIAKIDDYVVVALENLQRSMDELRLKFKGKEVVLAILRGVEKRAGELLEKGQISPIDT
ncbi:MAG TPA: hypothetical protein VJC06_02245 [Candidatus Paceibacterota bacterium]